MNTRIAQVLNDCIDLLAKGESVEACLALNQELAEELEPLLCTAEATLNVARITPDPGRKEAAKRRFLAAVEKEAPHPRRLIFFSTRLRPIAASLAAVFVLMALTTGAMVASADSTPADPLYPVKRATERVQLLLVRDDGKAALHLELAERRLTELQTVAAQQGAVPTNLLSEVAQETDEAINDLNSARDKELLAQRLLSLTSRQQSVLTNVASKAPNEAREGLDKAIEVSREGHALAATAVAGGKQDGRRDGDDKDNKQEQRPAVPPPASIGVSPPPAAEAVDPQKNDDKAKGDKRDDKGRTPTDRGGNPGIGDDNSKRDSIGRPTPDPTPTVTPTPRSDNNRGGQPGTGNGKKDSGNKDKHKDDN